MAPESLNAPARSSLPTEDAKVKEDVFSASAHVRVTRRMASDAARPGTATLRPGTASRSAAPGPGGQQPSSGAFAHRRRIADGKVLASSARRAGQFRSEAVSYFANGVLLDNMADFSHAVQQYKHFLGATLRTGDVDLQALALNCIGVDLCLLGTPTGLAGALTSAEPARAARPRAPAASSLPPVRTGTKGGGGGKRMDAASLAWGDLRDLTGAVRRAKVDHARNHDPAGGSGGSSGGSGGGSGGSGAEAGPAPTEQGRAWLRQAVEVHKRHLGVADAAGQFVAYTNAGVAAHAMGEFMEAAGYHQSALRVAISLRDPQSQCLAVGNLGFAAAAQGDVATARACLGQHMQLARSLRDTSAEAGACLRLGVLANLEGQYDQAMGFFLRARRLAHESGEAAILKQANCNLGVAQGNLRMKEHMAGVPIGGLEARVR